MCSAQGPETLDAVMPSLLRHAGLAVVVATIGCSPPAAVSSSSDTSSGTTMAEPSSAGQADSSTSASATAATEDGSGTGGASLCDHGDSLADWARWHQPVLECPADATSKVRGTTPFGTVEFPLAYAGLFTCGGSLLSHYQTHLWFGEVVAEFGAVDDGSDRMGKIGRAHV